MSATLKKIISQSIEQKINELSLLKDNIDISLIKLDNLEINDNDIKKETFCKEYCKKKLANLKGQPFIYIIHTQKELNSTNTKKYEEIKENFAMARINSITNNNNNCLYIGSSHDIQKRILEHFGYGTAKTYSLHLKEWLTNNSITIYIYQSSKNISELQFIEDSLWAYYQPRFGRQGKK